MLGTVKLKKCYEKKGNTEKKIEFNKTFESKVCLRFYLYQIKK